MEQTEKQLEFERFIRGKLAEAGLNMSKLAEMLNTSHSNISQRIKRASFDCVELYDIADKLGYKIEWVKK